MIVRDRLGADVDGKLTALARASVAELPAAAHVDAPPHVDSSLLRVRKLLATLAPLGSSNAFTTKVPRAPRLGAVGYRQYVDESGGVSPANSPIPAPLLSAGAEVAARHRGGFYANAIVSGERARVLTASATSGLAVQTALPLSDVDKALADLRTALLIVSLCGIVLAALLAPVIAKGLLRPVVALTDAAERVSRTRNLKESIDTKTSGELGRLSRAFDRMLRALEASADAQRQLVADASHELRTPLASLHMNIELLAEGPQRLRKEDRQRLINDLAEQVQELGTLTNDLIDLAHEEDVSSQLEELRLDTLVGEVVNRRRRHAASQRFEVKTAPCVVRGVAQQLARAVTNLLDNAVKWNPANQPIEVQVSNGTVVVRDHGPGIAQSDLPHVFERFYRSDHSRGLPGSGLGLAIVHHVAEAHGGHVSAENALDGGALLSFSLPVVS